MPANRHAHGTRPSNRRNARLDVGAEAFADLYRLLPADKAERNLGRGLRRDHRLEAAAGIAADDAVDLGRGTRPGEFEDRAALFARRDRKTDRAEEIFARASKLCPLCLDVGRRFFDTVVEARQRDGARLVMKTGENVGENVNRIGGSTAIIARMQVAARRLDDDFFADRPRRPAEIAGVSASHMDVSQTSAKSAFSSSRLASRKGSATESRTLPHLRTGW